MEAAVRQLLPDQIPLILQNEALLNDATPSKSRGDKYIIPIVFHIIHNYGPENITDEQIHDAVRILNEDYQKKNPDTASVIPLFQPIIGNCNFEFRLASKDPQGNCTTGIDRIASYKTYQADDQSKLNSWNPAYYLNIWVVNTIGKEGVAGYAYKPATAGIIFYYDGVLILHDYVGSIGTSSPINSRSLTHEIGHCLNLDHTWGATNNPTVACGDDNVLDTPPTKGHTQCKLDDSVCTPGVIENVQNYMEYAFCSKMFTEGQKDRMIITLKNSVAQRKTLVSALAHYWSGVLDGPKDCAAIPDFNVNRFFTCPGNSITYKNYSFNDTLPQADWQFGSDATPSSSNTTGSVAVSYSQPGWKEVELTATSNAGSNTLKRKEYIYVTDPAQKLYPGYVNYFEDTSVYASWPIFNYSGNDFQWGYYTGSGAYSGWHSLYYNGCNTRKFPQNRTLSPGSDWDDIISPAYDLSSLSAGSAYVNFFVTGATRGAIITDMQDTLYLYYSTNCGSTWTKLKTFQNTTLYNGSYSAPFYPDALTPWKTCSVPITAGAISNQTYFKLRYKPVDLSNNIFLDNFEVNSTPAMTRDEKMSGYSAELIPNPAHSALKAEINSTESGSLVISIRSLPGALLYQKKVEVYQGVKNSVSLDWSGEMKPGVYLVQFELNGKRLGKKLVIE